MIIAVTQSNQLPTPACSTLTPGSAAAFWASTPRSRRACSGRAPLSPSGACMPRTSSISPTSLRGEWQDCNPSAWSPLSASQSQAMVSHQPAWLTGETSAEPRASLPSFVDLLQADDRRPAHVVVLFGHWWQLPFAWCFLCMHLCQSSEVNLLAPPLCLAANESCRMHNTFLHASSLALQVL